MKRLLLGGQSLVTGRGSLAYLKEVQAKRAFIVTGSQSMIKNGVIDHIQEMLGENGCSCMVHSGVCKNPDTRCILDGVQQMRAFKPDLLVAVGGGSPMDASKVMGLFYEYPELDFESVLNSPLPARRKNLSLIAIATTSGTASEVTRSAVVTFRGQKLKIGLKSDAFIPDIAILDAQLTLSMPDHVVAETGMDAMTHAVEAYCNANIDDFTEPMARGAVEGLYRYLPVSYHSKTVESREKVHHYQCLAGLAFTNAGLGMVHGIAHAIGGKYDEAHGLINAVALPYVLQYNAKSEVVAAKLDTLARSIGVSDFIMAIRDLNETLNIPVSFAQMGISQAAFDDGFQGLVENAMKGSTRSNPVAVTREDMARLLMNIYKGAFDE